MSEVWGIATWYVTFYPLLMSFVWVVGGLLFFFRWERKPRCRLKEYPLFSIIVAAHNEQGSIADVVHSLSRLNYPRYEVIVVNDGSTDNTSRILDDLAARYTSWLRVVHLAPNSGKSNAVNVGALFSKGDLLMVVDADCFLHRNALRMMAWHFIHFPRVGAVTGNPRIVNRTCLLGKIQVGEYSSIIGLIKRSQRILGKVLTVSGVVAAYRRSAFDDCHFFDSDTATEDIDITWKLQKRAWEVRYEPRALCYILSPETVKGLWKQRTRWAKGGISVVRKHCDIWKQWRHHRFWLVYLEFVSSVFWALCLGGVLIWYIIVNVLHLFGMPGLPRICSPQIGSILAAMCLIQFLISMYVDGHYERKTLMKYYFWIIWYPFFYWIISALSVYAGLFEVFVKRGGASAIWQSPDRGLHTLE